MSKSAGSALDLIIRSRSSVVSLFSFALLHTSSATTVRCNASIFHYPPVLEPDLDLTWAETRDLARKPLSMRRIGMRLPCKFAHQEPCLIVCQATQLLVFALTVMRQFECSAHRNRFILRFCARNSAAVIRGLPSSSSISPPSPSRSSSSIGSSPWSPGGECGVRRPAGLVGADPPNVAGGSAELPPGWGPCAVKRSL